MPAVAVFLKTLCVTVRMTAVTGLMNWTALHPLAALANSSVAMQLAFLLAGCVTTMSTVRTNRMSRLCAVGRTPRHRRNAQRARRSAAQESVFTASGAAMETPTAKMAATRETAVSG